MDNSNQSFLPDSAITTFLSDSGLVARGEDAIVVPLAGGIASDIWKVETASRVFVLKRALAHLRVSQVWDAPVSRNASEAAWMEDVGRAVPGAVPRLLACDEQAGIFAMSYFDPARYPVWKQELQTGRADPAFAAQVGNTIAKIHAATAGSEDVAIRYANDGVFHSIRIEPYFEATARRHLDLTEPLLRLARETLCSKRALVHGDVSPKNILVGINGPIFLDAECAWFGDPAFDLAFCLNHLLLKCLWRPSARDYFLASFDAMAASYLTTINWEPADALEVRAARLLPALLLARIDGKSPVEYIEADRDKDCVRRFARSRIASPPLRLSEIRCSWEKEIAG